MEKKQVLLYGFGDQQEALCQILERFHAEPRPVSEEEADETIGYLCGLPGFHRKNRKKEGTLSPLLVFHNISREELDGILQAIRESGITVQSLKAMVTPTNENWTLRSLFGEIQQEHETMNALMKLKRLRDQAPAPDIGNPQMMMALMHAEQMLSGTREVTVREVEEAYRQLLAVIEK